MNLKEAFGAVGYNGNFLCIISPKHAFKCAGQKTRSHTTFFMPRSTVVYKPQMHIYCNSFLKTVRLGVVKNIALANIFLPPQLREDLVYCFCVCVWGGGVSAIMLNKASIDTCLALGHTYSINTLQENYEHKQICPVQRKNGHK